MAIKSKITFERKVRGMYRWRHTTKDTRNFAEQSTNPFGTLGNLNVEKLFYCERVAKFIGHWNEVTCYPSSPFVTISLTHRNVVESIKVGKSLNICLILDQFFSSAVEEANMLKEKSATRSDTRTELHTGSARKISSPFSSKIIRSTP